MLRTLLLNPDQFLYSEFSEPSSWKNNIGLTVNGIDVRHAFSTQTPMSFDFEDGECVDTVSEYLEIRDHKLSYLLERLGLSDFAVDNTSQSLMHVSNEQPIGWGIAIRHLWITQHTVFEIGDDENHVRFDIKDAWDGNPYNFQIDQITIWDAEQRYDIPCNQKYTLPYIEDLLRTVEIATQAISNGDDEQAAKVLKEINDIKTDVSNVLPSYKVMRLTNP
jgi:hypothetical protein